MKGVQFQFLYIGETLPRQVIDEAVDGCDEAMRKLM
jgi:hypothetical protein